MRRRHDADHRRLQVRPDARRRAADRHRAAGGAGARRPAAALRRLDERRPHRHSPFRGDRRARPRGDLRALRGPGRAHVVRLQRPPPPAGRSTPPIALDRRVAVVGRSMRKNLNIARRLGHADVPEGVLVSPKEIDSFRDEQLVVLTTGSQGEPLVGAAAHVARRASAGDAALGRHDHLLGDADPGQRAGRQRDRRSPVPDRRNRHHRPGRRRPRVRTRLDGGAEADAQPDRPAVRDADPRRSQAALPARASSPSRWASTRRRSSREGTACRWRSTSDGRPLRRRGAVGHGLRRRRRGRRHRGRRAARPPRAVGRRDLHRRRDGVGPGRPLARRRRR